MKKTYSYLLSLIALIALCACTHNGGPSGPLYGRWHLDHIEADNMADPNPDNNEIFWSFQSEMIFVQVKVGDHDFNKQYGSFRMDDNTLFVEFTGGKNSEPQSQTGLTLENELQVLKLSHSEMILLSHPDLSNPDATLTYYFRKW